MKNRSALVGGALLILSLLAPAADAAIDANAANPDFKAQPTRQYTLRADASTSQQDAQKSLNERIAALPEKGDLSNGIGKAEVVSRRDLPCKAQPSAVTSAAEVGGTRYACSAVITVRELGPPIPRLAKTVALQEQQKKNGKGDRLPQNSSREKPPAEASSNSLLQMAEQLDQLDRMDLNTALDAANDCTESRNFDCSETQLRKAAKLTRSAQDKSGFQIAQRTLANEQKAVEEERRREEEEIRLRVEEDERRQAQEERERRDEQAREWQEEQARQSAEASRIRSEANVGLAITQALDQTMRGYGRISSIHNNMVRDINARVQEEKRQRAEQERLNRENAQHQARQREEERRERLQVQRRNEEQQRSTQRADQDRQRGQRQLDEERRRTELRAQQESYRADQERQRQADEERRARQLADDQRRKDASVQQLAAAQMKNSRQSATIGIMGSTAKSGSDSPPATSQASAAEPTKRVLAFCWETKKGNRWYCDSKTQEMIIAEESLDEQLDMAGCKSPSKLGNGMITLKKNKSGQLKTGWLYDCGEHLETGDSGGLTWNRDIRRFWNGILW